MVSGFFLFCKENRKCKAFSKVLIFILLNVIAETSLVILSVTSELWRHPCKRRMGKVATKWSFVFCLTKKVQQIRILYITAEVTRKSLKKAMETLYSKIELYKVSLQNKSILRRRLKQNFLIHLSTLAAFSFLTVDTEMSRHKFSFYFPAQRRFLRQLSFAKSWHELMSLNGTKCQSSSNLRFQMFALIMAGIF